ncbi:aminopeptidase P family protein [Magnetospirillum sp. 64-120]|uniref:aminopeptidase P family protein n=1 Tax=Magnetospirillum sp. 64-120 TaxID=1895778 RepID=UPI000925869F|nr:aminopeptidase P family protein [Magnetospirillum sp. 64-120]OJX71350.1 MAG: X-Pro aminopeptidase [Magnetospirillum sp. 64-120]
MSEERVQGPAGADRIGALRDELTRRDLAGFVVPRADEHQGEYVPASAQRLAWLTGFTGSAGMATVLRSRAAIFVDGRYTIQVAQEVDGTLFEIRHMVDQPLTRWLDETLRTGDRLGYDPWLHTADQTQALKAACERAGAELVACDTNPVDAVWTDRPAPPCRPALPHPLVFAGRTSAEKRLALSDTLRAERLDGAVLTDPASLAWLLNVRGDDVAYVPLPLSFAIIHGDGSVDWFLDPAKSSPALVEHLGGGVTLRHPDHFLAALGQMKGRVRVDKTTAPMAVVQALTVAGVAVDQGADPCTQAKACKNPVELAGARAAHRRDGAAMVRFLAWLERQDGLDELTAADQLYALRAEGQHFRGLSFPTIAGAGPNGAIVHYRSSERTNRKLLPGQLFLLDSGAQYLDGTTDVTRTLAIRTPSAEMRRRFTLVLKGHIAIARAVFPEGTTGSQLDVLARRALWENGLDYDHGTGHGVGSYLSVHEGPQRISKLGTGAVPLRAGMIVSNEPGYYKAGAYGIRIEALVAVEERPLPQGGERPLLGFETLTLVPIDRKLVETGLLDAAERAWLDAYHARVWDDIAPLVDETTKAWLRTATAPLDKD